MIPCQATTDAKRVDYVVRAGHRQSLRRQSNRGNTTAAALGARGSPAPAVAEHVLVPGGTLLFVDGGYTAMRGPGREAVRRPRSLSFKAGAR